MMSPPSLWPLVVGLCVGLAGCTRVPPEAPPAPVAVAVSVPVERDVTDYADYTGRTAAVDSVELRARVERLNADFARAERLVKTAAISQEDRDKVAGDRGEAIASRAAAQAAVERAKLDLQYTKVTAPVSGRVSRYNVTVGNLVQA